MSKEDASDFKQRFTNLKVNNDFAQAVGEFEKLILDYREKYKSFMSHIWLRRKYYLTFLKYPNAVRNYIYTTNTSENFHRLIEKLRGRMGGFFQSEEILGINIVLQLNKLKKGKWKKPIPHFKSNEYELLQMHRLKFRNFEKGLETELKKGEREMEEAATNNKYKKAKSTALEIQT